MASIDGQVPSKDPADDGTLAGAFRSIFKKLMQNVDGMLPAKVISYDRTSNVATVQPLVHLLTTEGKTLPRSSYAAIPVLALGGGGFVLNFPLKAGDYGWIEASDRDISLFMQGGDAAQPNTTRIHSFADGRFIPDVMSKYQLGDADVENEMILATTDGVAMIAINTNHDVRIETTGNVRVQKAATFHVEDSVSAATFDCPVTFTKPVTATDEVTIKGVHMSVHEHVETGTKTQGPVNP